MILRRLHEHVRTHNWFAVVIDLLIVVIGVFIGMQVSNWNAERIQRREAHVYIGRIREDIAATAERFAEVIATNGKIRSYALAALDAFEKPRAELGEQFLIDAFLASMSWTGTADRSTYDEILSVGVMNSIPNVEVRRHLAIYYKSVELLEDYLSYRAPYRDNVKRLMLYAVQEAIRERCDSRDSVNSHGFPTKNFPERCDLKLPPETIAAAVAAIQTPELQRDLVRRVSDLDSKLDVYRRLLERGNACEGFLAESKF